MRSVSSLRPTALVVLWVLFTAPAWPATSAAAAEPSDWPQFRGPDGQGHASATGLSLTWSETANIRWKTAIPGLGWSSPAIQGRQVWLTTAEDKGQTLKALCIDRETGKILRNIIVFAKNTPTQLHPSNSHASPSPIIDGDHVFVHFGQYGTACLATDGKVIWKTTLAHNTMYGPTSTPVLAGELLIVPCYGTDVRYLVALDRATGKERWRKIHGTQHSESTPLVIQTDGAAQVVTTLTNRVVAHDPKTGQDIWWATLDWGYAVVPRPVTGHGLIFVAGGYFNPTLYAFRLGGKGDVTKTHLAWSTRKAVPNNPSPLVVGNEIYMVNDKGILTCLDAKTGQLRWSERLGGGFYASPLHADGRIYVSSQEGVTTVIARGPKFQKLAVNRVAGQTFASLAVAGKAIYLRSDRHLYRIEEDHVPAKAEEPRAKQISLERAARSLDSSALAWQKVNQCSQCHANLMHLIARPALDKIVPPGKEIRAMYESLVAERWEKQGLRYPSESMVVAVPLAFNDRRTTDALHPLTRKALDRMLTHQRSDGGWNGIGGAARTFINEYEETLLAALGIAVAPGDYAQTAAAKKALDGIRKYIRAHPPTTPNQQGMLLWAARHVAGLATDADRKKAVAELLALQRADGGWALPRLVADEDTPKFKGGKYADKTPSDGYGTGFVVFVARQAGVKAKDARIKRGVAWLKANQRASGRWFTPSLNHYTKQNLPSNSGTAFAVLALEACGEIPNHENTKERKHERE